MNGNDFRRIALGMDGAVEGSHMNHPDFRVNGRIFATLDHDEASGMVKLSPHEQRQFMQAYPDIFVPAAGAWGRQGCTLVAVADADENVLGEAVTLAWQAAVRASVAKTPKTRRPRPSKRRALARKRSRPARSSRRSKARR
jgi:YjbR protein